jgi:hypothetical protein
VVHRSIQQDKEKKSEAFEIFQNCESGGATEQFLSKTPLLNIFLTVRPIFTSNKPIDSAKEGRKNLTYHYFAVFPSRGAWEQFLSKTSLSNNF